MLGASRREQNTLGHGGTRSLGRHASCDVLLVLRQLARGHGRHSRGGTRGPDIASGVRGDLRVWAGGSRPSGCAVRGTLGDVASPVSWHVGRLTGVDWGWGRDTVRGVASLRLMVWVLWSRASGGRWDAGGRTTRCVAGAVRVALHRLARRDRRDASRTTGSITRRMRALGSRARGSGMNIGWGTTGSVAHGMRRDLGNGASRKGRDTGGRTRMLVTGRVRVAFGRLARGDRRDDSGLTGSLARRMRRDLWGRSSRNRRYASRRATLRITGAMGTAPRRRSRGRRAYRDPSRTASWDIASRMKRDLRGQTRRRGRNVGRRAGWNLTGRMGRELRGRACRGHVRRVSMRDITRRMGRELCRATRGGRRDASRRSARGIARTVSRALGRRVSGSRV